MNHPDPQFLAVKLKTAEVTGNEVEQEDATQEISSRKDGNFPGGALGSPVNEEAAEKLVLHFVGAKMDLRERSPKDEDESEREARDGQPERGEEFDEAIKEHENI